LVLLRLVSNITFVNIVIVINIVIIQAQLLVVV